MFVSVEFLITVKNPFDCEEMLHQFSCILNLHWVLPIITSALQALSIQSENSLCIHFFDKQQQIPAVTVTTLAMNIISVAVVIQAITSALAAYEIWQCCQKSGRDWGRRDTDIIIRIVVGFAITFSSWFIVVFYLIYESTFSHYNAIVTPIVVIAFLTLAAIDSIVYTLSLGEFIS